jgi:sugar phosphate isomerase/epimerase
MSRQKGIPSTREENVMRKTWTWSTTGYNFLDRPQEEIVRICILAGLSGIEGAVELFADPSAARLERIAALYREAGLRIDSFHLPFAAEDDIASFYETARQKAVTRMQQVMEQAARLGARVVIQHPSTSRYSVAAEGLETYLRQIERSLQALLPRAEKLGLIVALENMLPGPDGPRLGSSPEHFAVFDRRFAHPHLGFCLDTGHALVAGGPGGAHAFFQAMAPRLAAFHLADNAGDRDSHLAPGRGLVDWDPLFRGAAELGFAHPMCIETPPFAPGPNLTYSPAAWQQMVAQTDALAARALGS